MKQLKLFELKPSANSRKKKFIRGRGHGSGNGKTSGRGHKGQKARSGGKIRLGSEGGQMPLFRKVPKRGFKNINKKNIVAINLSHLNIFEENSVIDFENLKNKGLISKIRDGIKILGNGELKLNKNFKIKANYFSKNALNKIKKAGCIADVV